MLVAGIIIGANPIGIIALGTYGLLDSIGVFNGVKDYFGMDETIIVKDN